MQFINYFSASIISFSGLLIGMMLIKIAPEEQKPLSKYFVFSRRTWLLMIFIFIFFYYYNNPFNLVVLLAYSAFLLLVEYKSADLLKKNIIVYTSLGILFFLSSKNTSLFAIESSLILLYGLPAMSLIYNKKERNEYKAVLYSLGFVIIANLLYFMYSK